MMKTKEDNDVIDRIGAIYAENETELSWPIRLSVVYDKNQTRQQHDLLNRCNLRQKGNWVVVID